MEELETFGSLERHIMQNRADQSFMSRLLSILEVEIVVAGAVWCSGSTMGKDVFNGGGTVRISDGKATLHKSCLPKYSLPTANFLRFSSVLGPTLGLGCLPLPFIQSKPPLEVFQSW